MTSRVLVDRPPAGPSLRGLLQPCVHPVYARLLCAELLRRGFTQPQVLLGTRLSWSELHLGNEFLSYAQLHALVTRATELTARPSLGLEVGLTTELSAHGAVGYAAMASANVAEVLPLLQRYSSLRQRLVSFDLSPATHPVALVLTEHLPDASIREYVLGHVTGALLRLLQSVTGRDWASSIVVHWPLAKTEPADDYLRQIPGIRFGASAWRIELPPAALGCPSLAPDPQAHRLAVRDCELQLTRKEEGSVAARIREHLLDVDGSFPGLEQMAQREHVSARTLIRHLRAEGTSYQDLLDRVRADLACWLLVQSELPMEAIAERLGYADTSNFSRTFRRWCGVTPGAFRRRRG